MKLLLWSLIFTSTWANAHQATYFRAWQGFQKSTLSQDQFIKELPTFMKDTVEIYRERALDNYFVIIPPKNKPAYIPDELALVALTSKEQYQSIRQTPEGQRYSDRHWDIFNKENSKSAEPIDYVALNPQTLEHNKAYDVIGKPIYWESGHTTAYIGLKKEGLTSSEFLTKLKSHIDLVKRAFEKKGLRGYIILANDNYEVAYMNWESKNTMETAFKTSAAELVLNDGNSFLKLLMFENAEPYRVQFGSGVEHSKFYTTMPISSNYYDPYDPNGNIDSH